MGHMDDWRSQHEREPFQIRVRWEGWGDLLFGGPWYYTASRGLLSYQRVSGWALTEKQANRRAERKIKRLLRHEAKKRVKEGRAEVIRAYSPSIAPPEETLSQRLAREDREDWERQFSELQEKVAPDTATIPSARAMQEHHRRLAHRERPASEGLWASLALGGYVSPGEPYALLPAPREPVAYWQESDEDIEPENEVLVRDYEGNVIMRVKADEDEELYSLKADLEQAYGNAFAAKISLFPEEEAKYAKDATDQLIEIFEKHPEAKELEAVATIVDLLEEVKDLRQQVAENVETANNAYQVTMGEMSPMFDDGPDFTTNGHLV